MSSLSSVGGTSTAANQLSSTTASSSASSPNSSTGTISVGGLISGLNTSQIITGLLAVQQQQITSVQTRQSAVTQQETAYKALQAQLLSFQASVTQLAQSVNGPFDGRTATSSNTSALTAAASSNAIAGVYGVTVKSVAQANEIASQGFANATSQINTGTLTIGSGSSSATVTINSTNNTLQGLATAINNACAGVSATVINTGAAGQPYRLLLSATNTGTANAITLTNNLTNLTIGGVQPQFNQNTVGAAVAASTNSGSAVATSGGTYTGATNNTYTFTVDQTDPTKLDYTNSSDDTDKGQITIASNHAELTTSNADLTLAFTGTPNAGDQFTINTTVPTVQAAADASVTLGSGNGALTVTSSNNTVNTAINGVTLNLLANSAGQSVQVTVANDTTTAQTAIQNFVTAYNSVMSTISNDVSYDPQTQTAGALLGDPSILNIQNQIQSLVTQPVSGANPKLNNLSALGLTLDASGQLQVDSTTLNNVLSGNVSGVTLSDVRNLFAVGGQSTNAGVTFVNSTSATKPSATPYGVDITQAAQQATLTAGTSLSSNTVVSSGSNTFTLTVNGVASNTLTIPPSSGLGYTQQALVQALQAQINSDPKIGNDGVTVGLQGNALTFTSGTYGQASTLSISAATVLGFRSAASAAGTDVAGSFLVNGKSESATGSGRLLTGNSGNANTDGLSVNVTLLPSQITTGAEANLTVTQGVAAQLGKALNSLLDPTTGQLQNIDQNFQSQITAYQSQITQLQQEYNAKEAALTTEFTNMETTLSNLKNASNFITQQTAALQTVAGISSASSSVGTFGNSSSTTAG